MASIRVRKGAIQIQDNRKSVPILLETRGLHWEARIRRASNNWAMQVTIFNLRRDRATLWHEGQQVEVFAGYSLDVYGRVATGYVTAWTQVARNGGLDIGTQLTCTQAGQPSLALDAFEDRETDYAATVGKEVPLREACLNMVSNEFRGARSIRNPDLIPAVPVGRAFDVYPLGAIGNMLELLPPHGLGLEIDGDEYVIIQRVIPAGANAAWNLTADSGMIGIPRATNYGLEVKATVIPQLLVGDLVQVNSGVIHRCRGLMHNLSFEGTDWHTVLELEAPEQAEAE